MQISKLDASKLSQETTIKDLKANITSLQSKLNKLEKEHDDLGKKFSSHTVQADSEIKQLQQVRNIDYCFPVWVVMFEKELILLCDMLMFAWQNFLKPSK